MRTRNGILAAALWTLACASPSLGMERAWGAKIPDWTQLRIQAASTGPEIPSPDPLTSGIRIVELPLDIGMAQFPSFLAAAATAVEPAIKAARSAIAAEPGLLQTLASRGYGADQVIAVDRAETGVTIFTSRKALQAKGG